MSSPVPSEGLISFPVSNAGKECFTWYRIFGTLSPTTVPLITLHGGPGSGHNYLVGLCDLSTQHGIPVVVYDQLGCGRSTVLPEKNGDESFWTIDLFERELDNLRSHLGINEFDLFGHSWGGMLASTYASKQQQPNQDPARSLRKLVLMSTPASIDLSLEGMLQLRGQLPERMQEAMKRCERDEDFENPEYKEACQEFYKRFFCRCDPLPPELLESRGNRASDNTVYGTMYGPEEVTCTGNLKGWTAIPDAHKILNSTLLINGEFDEAVEAASAPFFEEIPKVKWVFLPHSSHMGMLEERERVVRIISRFLKSKD